MKKILILIVMAGLVAEIVFLQSELEEQLRIFDEQKEQMQDMEEIIRRQDSIIMRWRILYEPDWTMREA